MNNTERHSTLCPNCRKLIGSDESHCPYCGINTPGSWQKINTLSKIAGNGDKIIQAILYTNIGMYVLSLLLYPGAIRLTFDPFSLLSPDGESLILLGATGTIPVDRMGRWWTIVSANYLHGGIIHLLFNMAAFRQLGPLVLRTYGVHRFIALYVLTGIAGFWVSYLAGVKFTIGASAAVCGLIGATLYYGKSRGDAYGEAIYKQVSGWVMGLFIFGLLVPRINNWGHGGGLVAGILLGFLLGYLEKRRENISHKVLGWACILLTLIVLGGAIGFSVYYRIGGGM